jgi:hypothetical protein
VPDGIDVVVAADVVVLESVESLPPPPQAASPSPVTKAVTAMFQVFGAWWRGRVGFLFMGESFFDGREN